MAYTSRGRKVIHITHRGSSRPLTVTANGTYESDAGGGYSPIIVDIPGGGVATEILEVTENGTYEAPAGVAYRKVVVNVPQGEIVKPGIVLRTSIDTCYDPYDTELTTIPLTLNITKGTNPLGKASLYCGTKLLKEYDPATTGSVSFTYTPDSPIKTTTTFKAVVEDKQGNATTSVLTITFVGKTFYGIFSDTIVTPTEAEIKALKTVQKPTKAYTQTGINTDYGKVGYAYPVSLGALSKITDVKSGFTVTDSFSVKSVAVNGVLYYVYIQTDPSAAENVSLVYA